MDNILNLNLESSYLPLLHFLRFSTCQDFLIKKTQLTICQVSLNIAAMTRMKAITLLFVVASRGFCAMTQLSVIAPLIL